MNKRNTFNIVAEHLLKQGGRASEAEGTCLYRASDGRKCAFGVLIPDELYNPILENTTVDHIFGLFSSRLKEQDRQKYDMVAATIRAYFGPLNVEEVEFLRTLQQVHDNKPTEWWEIELARIAGKYDLEVDVIIQNRRR